jgi:hypothetical protein
VAPGVSISGAKGSGSGYGTRSGTSMSAPQVAGAFAILRQAYPALSLDAIESALKQTGTPVTRADSGITVAKIQVGAALDKLQGVNRRFVNNVFANVAAQGESMLRFYNPSEVVGNVKVAIRDGDTGVYLGDWVSPPIPSHAALQFTAKSVLANATRNGFPVPAELRAYLNLEVASSFKGSAQHVLFSDQARAISNLTNCGSTPATDTAKHLMNVHSGAFVEFPSRLRIVNTGVAPAKAKLSFYNAGTGVKVFEWTTPEITSAATHEVSVPSIEARVTIPAGAMDGGNGYYNVTVDGFSGYLQHLVENIDPGVLVDMTAKCDVIVSALPINAP